MPQRFVLPSLLLSYVASSVAAQSLCQSYGEAVQGVGDAVAALPGVTIGGTSPYSVPVMDLDGRMIWRARLAGLVTTNVDDQALFVGRSANDVQMLLQRGAAEPTGTMPGVNVNYSSTGWDQARLSPTGGYVLVGSSLTGAVTTANDSCLFYGILDLGGLTQVLVREGDLAPSGGATISGTVGGAQNVTAINSSGTAVCKVRLVGGDAVASTNDDAWLIGVPSGLSFMCREGDLLDASGTLAISNTLDGFKPTIDELGRVLFAQALSQTAGSTPATAANDSTIMLYTPGSGLSLVMREGDPAPGSGGCVYGSVSSSSGFSNHGFSRTSGRVVFTNTMTGGDATSNTVDTAVFAGDITGNFARVAREGEPAPTGVPGEIYQALFPNGVAQINDAGTVVFVAQLGPTGLASNIDVGVFLARPPYGPGDVQMILREGDSVAGLPTGWVIGNTNGGGMSSSGTTLMLNERDTVLVSVAGVGDPTATNFGVPALIGWDPENLARLVSMQGDTFTIQSQVQVQSAAPGILATSSGDGGNLSFNNNGDLCFRGFFSGTVATAIMRVHVGDIIGEPSSVPAAGGVTHNLHIQCGTGHAGEVYFVVASSLGTRPGFLSPFGPQNVPLNFDPLWMVASIDNFNSVVWPNSLGLLDANGAATSAFVMPPGLGALAGTRVHHCAALFDLSAAGTFVTEPTPMWLY